MSESQISDIVIADRITDIEKKFVFQGLLACDYFQKHRHGYYTAREHGVLNSDRNYALLLTFLNEIYEYNQQHAKSFAKRLREASKDWRNCEAIFSEIIVYRSYVRGTHEQLIRKIDLNGTEADIIIERPDGSKAFLEVFCVMPSFPQPEKGAFAAFEVKSHTQTEMGSIRQKLLRKIAKQKQLSKARENYAVIELNDASIAGDFSVLSSLSSGYTLTINKKTKELVSADYNWEKSVFDDPSTQFLKGIIYFNLGDYGSRKFLFNPHFRAEPAEDPR